MKTAMNLTLCFLILTPPVSIRAEDPPIKITDAKLHSVNYGIDSLEHWVRKAKPGDKRRADGLARDHEKLVTRFSRIPASDTDQYKYVADRLKQLRPSINQLAGEGKLHMIDSWAQLCTNTMCSTMQNGDSYYFDNNHMNNHGAIELRNIFSKFLKPAQ